MCLMSSREGSLHHCSDHSFSVKRSSGFLVNNTFFLLPKPFSHPLLYYLLIDYCELAARESGAPSAPGKIGPVLSRPWGIIFGEGA